VARPDDWSALDLNADPTPGDPETVDGIVDYMKLIQTAASDARAGIKEIMDGTGDEALIGRTGDWLRAEVDSKTSEFLNAVADAFETAAPAMATYAQKLRDVQATADDALTQAQALEEDDDEARETLRAQALEANTDLQTAAETAAAAIDGVSEATNPWAKSACDQFWDIFFYIMLVLTLVGVIFGGTLGLIAWAAAVVWAVHEVVDYATGKASLTDMILGLVGVLFPTTKGISSLLKGFGKSAANALKVGWRGAGALLSKAWNLVRNLTLASTIKGVTDIGTVLANSVKTAGGWVANGITSAGALAKGFVVTHGYSITAMSATAIKAVVNLVGSTAGTIGKALSTALRTSAKFAGDHLGGWQWLRVITPLEASEIRLVGVAGAAEIAVLGRGLGISKYTSGTILSQMEGLVQLTDGVLHPTGMGSNGELTRFARPGVIVSKLTGDELSTLDKFSKAIIDLDQITPTQALKGFSGQEIVDLRAGLNKLDPSSRGVLDSLTGTDWQYHSLSESTTTLPSGLEVPTSAFSASAAATSALGHSATGVHAAGASLGATSGLVGVDGVALAGRNVEAAVQRLAGMNLTALPGRADAGSLLSSAGVARMDTMSRVGNLGSVLDMGTLGVGARISDGTTHVAVDGLKVTDGVQSIAVADLRLTDGTSVISLQNARFGDGTNLVRTTGLRMDSPATGAGLRMTDGTTSVDIGRAMVTDGVGTTMDMSRVRFTDGNGVVLDLGDLRLSDGFQEIRLGADLRVVDPGGAVINGTGQSFGVSGLAEHILDAAGLRAADGTFSGASLYGLGGQESLDAVQNLARRLSEGTDGSSVFDLSGLSRGTTDAGAVRSAPIDFSGISPRSNARLDSDMDGFAAREFAKLADGGRFRVRNDFIVQADLELSPEELLRQRYGQGALETSPAPAATRAADDVQPVTTDHSTARSGSASTDATVSLPGSPATGRSVAARTDDAFDLLHDGAQVSGVETVGVREDHAWSAAAEQTGETADSAGDAASAAARRSDLDTAGSGSPSSRPDLAGGELTVPGRETSLAEGELTALTADGRQVSATARQEAAAAATARADLAGDARAARAAELEAQAERLGYGPLEIDPVVTYHQARDAVEQTAGALLAGRESGQLSPRQIARLDIDAHKADAIFRNAEKNLREIGLDPVEVRSKALALEAADAAYRSGRADLVDTYATRLDRLAERNQLMPGKIHGQALARGEFADPAGRLGISADDWTAIERAAIESRLNPSVLNERALQAALDSAGVDRATYDSLARSRELGPSPSQIAERRQVLEAGGQSATDEQIRRQLTTVAQDEALATAMRSDGNFWQVRDNFAKAFREHIARNDFAEHLTPGQSGAPKNYLENRAAYRDAPESYSARGAESTGAGADFALRRAGIETPMTEANLAAREVIDQRLTYAQWLGDPMRVGDRPEGVDLNAVFRLHDEAVTVLPDADRLGRLRSQLRERHMQSIAEQAAVRPPGDLSIGGLSRVWEEYLDVARTRFQKLLEAPGGTEHLEYRLGQELDSLTNVLKDAFSREARFEKNLIPALERFDAEAQRLTPLELGAELAEGAAERAKLSFAADLRSEYNRMLRTLEDDFAASAPDAVAELGADAALAARIDHVDRAFTAATPTAWEKAVDDLVGSVADRLRFEGEANVALRAGGRDFESIAGQHSLHQDVANAVAADFREDLAAVFHDAYGAGGSLRTWLDHEAGAGRGFGLGRSSARHTPSTAGQVAQLFGRDAGSARAAEADLRVGSGASDTAGTAGRTADSAADSADAGVGTRALDEVRGDVEGTNPTVSLPSSVGRGDTAAVPGSPDRVLGGQDAVSARPAEVTAEQTVLRSDQAGVDQGSGVSRVDQAGRAGEPGSVESGSVGAGSVGDRSTSSVADRTGQRFTGPAVPAAVLSVDAARLSEVAGSLPAGTTMAGSIRELLYQQTDLVIAHDVHVLEGMHLQGGVPEAATAQLLRAFAEQAHGVVEYARGSENSVGVHSSSVNAFVGYQRLIADQRSWLRLHTSVMSFGSQLESHVVRVLEAADLDWLSAAEQVFLPEHAAVRAVQAGYRQLEQVLGDFAASSGPMSRQVDAAQRRMLAAVVAAGQQVRTAIAGPQPLDLRSVQDARVEPLRDREAFAQAPAARVQTAVDVITRIMDRASGENHFTAIVVEAFEAAAGRILDPLARTTDLPEDRIAAALSAYQRLHQATLGLALAHERIEAWALEMTGAANGRIEALSAGPVPHRGDLLDQAGVDVRAQIRLVADEAVAGLGRPADVLTGDIPGIDLDRAVRIVDQAQPRILRRFAGDLTAALGSGVQPPSTSSQTHLAGADIDEAAMTVRAAVQEQVEDLDLDGLHRSGPIGATDRSDGIGSPHLSAVGQGALPMQPGPGKYPWQDSFVAALNDPAAGRTVQVNTELVEALDRSGRELLPPADLVAALEQPDPTPATNTLLSLLERAAFIRGTLPPLGLDQVQPTLLWLWLDRELRWLRAAGVTRPLEHLYQDLSARPDAGPDLTLLRGYLDGELPMTDEAWAFVQRLANILGSRAQPPRWSAPLGRNEPGADEILDQLRDGIRELAGRDAPAAREQVLDDLVRAAALVNSLSFARMPVRYPARVLDLSVDDGEVRLIELRPHLHLLPDSDVTAQQAVSAAERMRVAIGASWNDTAGFAAHGRTVFVRVAATVTSGPAVPETAHSLRLSAGAGRASAARVFLADADTTLSHETGHLLGLRDRYGVDPAAPQTADTSLAEVGRPLVRGLDAGQTLMNGLGLAPTPRDLREIYQRVVDGDQDPTAARRGGLPAGLDPVRSRQQLLLAVRDTVEGLGWGDLLPEVSGDRFGALAGLPAGHPLVKVADPVALAGTGRDVVRVQALLAAAAGELHDAAWVRLESWPRRHASDAVTVGMPVWIVLGRRGELDPLALDDAHAVAFAMNLMPEGPAGAQFHVPPGGVVSYLSAEADVPMAAGENTQVAADPEAATEVGPALVGTVDSRQLLSPQERFDPDNLAAEIAEVIGAQTQDGPDRNAWWEQLVASADAWMSPSETRELDVGVGFLRIFHLAKKIARAKLEASPGHANRARRDVEATEPGDVALESARCRPRSGPEHCPRAGGHDPGSRAGASCEHRLDRQLAATSILCC